jgi:hypothetical protein
MSQLQSILLELDNNQISEHGVRYFTNFLSNLNKECEPIFITLSGNSISEESKKMAKDKYKEIFTF